MRCSMAVRILTLTLCICHNIRQNIRMGIVLKFVSILPFFLSFILMGSLIFPFRLFAADRIKTVSQPAILNKTFTQSSSKIYDLRFQHLGIEDGLSQNSVYAIRQDKFGFLWFGTEDGLNRYDGYKISAYRHDPANPQSIGANFIQVIFEDSKGTLWIGTELGGLQRFNPHSETFDKYKNIPKNSNSLSNNSIRSIAEANDSILWIGTAFGLNAFNTKNGAVEQYLPPANTQVVTKDLKNGSYLSAQSVNALAVDKSGNVWAGTWGGGISILNPKTKKFVYLRQNPAYPESLSSDFIRCITIDSVGDVWVGTLRGLNKIQSKTLSITQFLPDNNNPIAIQGANIESIWQQNDSTLWLGTREAGISIFNMKTGVCLNLQANQTHSHSLNTNNINRIYGDRDGAIWIGTGGSGVNKYDARAWKFVSYHHEINNFNSLVHDVVRGFYEDKDGTLWIATEGGLCKFNRKKNEFIAYTNNPQNKNSLAGNIVRTVYRDAAERLWVGSTQGLQLFDDKRNKFTTYLPQQHSESALPAFSVRTILENKDGTMWIATEGSGIILFNPTLKTYRTFIHDPSRPRSLSHNNVISLYQDRKGTLWVGTLFGLNKYNPDTQDFTRYLRIDGNPHSLHSNNIRTMYEDEKGRFWIGTWGGGLHLFDRETGYCEVFREREGLPNDNVYGILPDDEGYLWLTTNKGLARFHTTMRTFRIYDAEDGLQSNEFNGGAYHVGHSGRFYVGGVRGMSEFFPHDIQDNKTVPQVVITGFKKFNKSVRLGVDIRNNAEITIPYTDKFFSIEFAALNFTHPQKNTYLYKMEGFDKAWIDAGTNREAAYTNLDAGTYIFHVKASNNDGCWNEEGAKLQITILPPWWMTIWFRFAVVLSLVSTGGVWFWTRLRRIEAQKIELEQLVEKRTFELKEMNTSLKDANHEIEQHIQTVSEQAWEIATINTQLQARNEELESLNREKDEFLGIAAHDLKNPLTSIVLTTELLQYNLQALPQSRILERLQQMEQTAMRMRDIVTDLLDINALESGKLKLHLDACDMGMLVEEVTAEYNARAAEKDMTILLDYDKSLTETNYVYADYRKTREVVENLVSNAVKYSPLGTTISMKVEKNIQNENTSYLQLSVKDQGPGLSEEDKERLFQRFMRLTPQPTGGEHSSGLGLSIAKKLMEAMNGRIWCETALGKGATFYIELPIVG